jgi:geranylgeranyl diphosphate synthase, type I
MLDAVTTELRVRVDAELRRFMVEAGAALNAVGSDLETLTEAAHSFVLDTGKRLRPAFCYWGARAAGAPDKDSLVAAAASLELLHACALVHDDVIDRSAMRRGRPAVHEHFARLHEARGWSGAPDAYGDAIAVLLGDLFLVWAEMMINGSGIGDPALARARPVLDLMRVELMAGQYLDVTEQALGGGSLERALRVTRYKTAKYTVERPLHLGAAIGDAPPELVAAMSGYGLPLGEAFQLRDDLLGVFGDPDLTGKPAGDDLREGKRTVLIALAVEAADPAGRSALSAGLGDPALDKRGVERLREIISAGGAPVRVEAMISDRVGTAVAALEGDSVDPDARRALVDLATAATLRAD